MKDKEVLGALIESRVQIGASQLQELGIKIGKLYTNNGLPIDVSLDTLKYSQQQKLSVLDGACSWLIEHKRASGATDKAIERQRRTNQKMIADFLKTGEVGAY